MLLLENPGLNAWFLGLLIVFFVFLPCKRCPPFGTYWGISLQTKIRQWLYFVVGYFLAGDSLDNNCMRKNGSQGRMDKSVPSDPQAVYPLQKSVKGKLRALRPWLIFSAIIRPPQHQRTWEIRQKTAKTAKPEKLEKSLKMNVPEKGMENKPHHVGRAGE